MLPYLCSFVCYLELEVKGLRKNTLYEYKFLIPVSSNDWGALSVKG